MGLGSTAKKVQRLSNLAEKLYEQVNEILERLSDLTDRVERAGEDIETVRRRQREHRAILEAIADEQGVDVEAVVEEVEDEESDAAEQRNGGTSVDGEEPADDAPDERTGSAAGESGETEATPDAN